MKLKDRIIVGTLTIGAIFTIFFAILIAGAMSSCTRIADDTRHRSNNWRARSLVSNAVLTVENPDSVDVMMGDTVLTMCIDGGTYDIINTDVRRDSTYGFFNGDSTEYTTVEQRVVVLERRSTR